MESWKGNWDPNPLINKYYNGRDAEIRYRAICTVSMTVGIPWSFLISQS